MSTDKAHGGVIMVLDAMKYRKRNKAWQKKYDALAPKVGDIAPDFELCDVNGETPVSLPSEARSP